MDHKREYIFLFFRFKQKPYSSVYIASCWIEYSDICCLFYGVVVKNANIKYSKIHVLC